MHEAIDIIGGKLALLEAPIVQTVVMERFQVNVLRERFFFSLMLHLLFSVIIDSKIPFCWHISWSKRGGFPTGYHKISFILCASFPKLLEFQYQ